MNTIPRDSVNNTELERLLIALSCRRQVDAAELLGVRENSLSDCKRRGGRVTGNLLEQALQAGIRREWIKEGEPPMRRAIDSKKECPAGKYCLESCPALEAVQQAVALIACCPHICAGCAHKMESHTE